MSISKIPLPDRGQPIDVTWLYTVANTVNEIENELSSATYNYTTVTTRDNGVQQVQTRASKIVASYVDVTINKNVTVASPEPFHFDYSGFKYPPIVTATIVNRGTSVIGNDAVPIINSITTSRVDGVIQFNTGGLTTITVNLIAVGIPA
jgi:hypothetical protein